MQEHRCTHGQAFHSSYSLLSFQFNVIDNTAYITDGSGDVDGDGKSVTDDNLILVTNRPTQAPRAPVPTQPSRGGGTQHRACSNTEAKSHTSSTSNNRHVVQLHYLETVTLSHQCLRNPLDSVVWIYHTFDKYLNISIDFAEYLEDSC